MVAKVVVELVQNQVVMEQIIQVVAVQDIQHLQLLALQMEMEQMVLIQFLHQ